MMPARAYVFIGLNIVRILSIIVLILVFSSSILVMVHDVTAVNTFMSEARASGNSPQSLLENCDYIENSTVPNQTAGIFWAVVNRLFITFQVVILFLSEISWPSALFERFFPVLSSAFGLGPLGVFQCLIGAAILSHRVDDFTLVSAFFLFSLGCLNIVLGLIFGASARSKRSLTEWRSDSDNVLPVVGDKRPVFRRPSGPFVSSTFSGNEKGRSEFGVRRNASDSSTAGFGFGRQGEKAAGLKGFLISKPLETLPRYAPKPPSTPQSQRDSGSSMYSDAPPQFKSSAHAI